MPRNELSCKDLGKDGGFCFLQEVLVPNSRGTKIDGFTSAWSVQAYWPKSCCISR